MKFSNFRKNRKVVSAGVVVALVGLSAAQAADDFASSKSRAQVQAELADAIRTGDIHTGGESPVLLNELFPTQYPAKARAAGKTREQVRVELAEAIRTGDIHIGGESPVKAKELFPGLYAPTAASYTRRPSK